MSTEPVEIVEDNPDQSSGTALIKLEEEGDIAADYLEELLDIADLDGDIDIEVRNGRPYVSIISEEGDAPALTALVGRDGEVLESLQELTRLAVLASTQSRTRLVLDIDHFRVRRAKVLVQLAREAADEVRKTGKSVALDPLDAYERKIVHDAIAELGLISESEGQDAERHIVVKNAS